LGKSLNAGALDSTVSKEDKEKLIAALREWGRWTAISNSPPTSRVEPPRL
jgi:hypothetical protein